MRKRQLGAGLDSIPEPPHLRWRMAGARTIRLALSAAQPHPGASGQRGIIAGACSHQRIAGLAGALR